mmetsp:Transcript_6561/g.15229  ORF Transcript_6561/g.15229 Transcript_6561/m.15229 type:complete len:96 (+) Transcript_6561:386-673(+)
MDTPLPFGKPPAVSAFLSEHTKTTTSVETISAHFADETNWDQSKTPSLTPKTPLRKLREIVKKEWEIYVVTRRSSVSWDRASTRDPDSTAVDASA